MIRISQKIRLESLKTRLRHFPRNILSPKVKREREMTLTLRMTSTISTVQSIKPKEGYAGLTLLISLVLGVIVTVIVVE